jgi:type I site-specific restriction endonuclease
MDHGLRDATGSRVGKTIVFARNHDHAVHLADVFSELYPQYGSTFCKSSTTTSRAPSTSSTTSRTRPTI